MVTKEKRMEIFLCYAPIFAFLFSVICVICVTNLIEKKLRDKKFLKNFEKELEKELDRRSVERVMSLQLLLADSALNYVYEYYKKMRQKGFTDDEIQMFINEADYELWKKITNNPKFLSESEFNSLKKNNCLKKIDVASITDIENRIRNQIRNQMLNRRNFLMKGKSE